MTAVRGDAAIRKTGLNVCKGSIFDDQATVILLILIGCFEFFQVAGLYRNWWRFSQEHTQSRSETGAKIIDVTCSVLFYFISSRELH